MRINPLAELDQARALEYCRRLLWALEPINESEDRAGAIRYAEAGDYGNAEELARRALAQQYLVYGHRKYVIASADAWCLAKNCIDSIRRDVIEGGPAHDPPEEEKDE